MSEMKSWEVVAYDAEGNRQKEVVNAINPQGAIAAAREKGLSNPRSISEVGAAVPEEEPVENEAQVPEQNEEQSDG